jgi:membrane protease YdiL (CAAX protease family)
LRRTIRLAIALAFTFAVIYLTNSAPEYLGPLESLAVNNAALFVGAPLILASLVFLWRGGYLRKVQSRGKFSAVEILEAGLLVIAVTAFFGLGPSPFNLCLGGGGGFVCYPSSSGFLLGLFDLVLIVMAEELFFRAYLINELDHLLGVGTGAVAASALLYSVFHLPALQVEGLGTVSLLGFLQVLIGAFTLSACYWYTGRNLAAVVLLHAYWDGVGALVFLPDFGQFGGILLILGQLSLPAAVLIVTHRFRLRLSPSNAGGEPSVPVGLPQGAGSAPERLSPSPSDSWVRVVERG